MADVLLMDVPPRLGRDGDLVTYAQGSAREVEAEVDVVARTEVGTRVGRPTLGVPDLALSKRIDASALARLIESQVDDSSVSVTAVPTGGAPSAWLRVDSTRPVEETDG